MKTFHRTASHTHHGFTLIETLVAISILMIAIIPPMSLTVESLSAAYYSRDQVTASNLAQEGIEVVRSVRDANILKIAEGAQNVNIFDGIPSTTGQPFTVNTLVDASNALKLCSSSGCPPLQTTGEAYGYNPTCSYTGSQWNVTDCPVSSGWKDTLFTRSVTATLIGGNPNELQVSVTVKWEEANLPPRTFTISEELYRWIADDSGT